MSQSPEAMAAAMVRNLEANTGKKLDAWLKILAKAGLEKHGEMVKLLKSEHGMTHGYANLVAQAFRNPTGSSEGSDLVAAQYSGPKAALEPIYEAVVKVVSKLGRDVELAPKKAYVSLRRSKQFALIQPSTKTRVDLGINLKGEPPTERLEASGSFNAMVSHRVRLESAKDVDRQVAGWLRQAYEQA